MFSGGWCGGMGIWSWVVMVVFWGAFLGLTLWAVTRMFPLATNRRVHDERGGARAPSAEQEASMNVPPGRAS